MEENKFKGWCAAHNVKVKDIADLLEIHINNASEKMNGKQNFTLPQVQLICKTYNISADLFLQKKLRLGNGDYMDGWRK